MHNFVFACFVSCWQEGKEGRGGGRGLLYHKLHTSGGLWLFNPVEGWMFLGTPKLLVVVVSRLPFVCIVVYFGIINCDTT